MTLQYMEGFESVVDNPDMTARGWLTSTATVTSGASTSTVPSRSGIPGRGLMLKGPYNNSLIMPFAASNNADFGMYDTGKKINDLWKTGGFSVGFNATFNKANQVQVASFGVGQIVYDGAQYYWAIIETGTTMQVGYSTDLINWTPTQTQPPMGVTTVAIDVSGSGPNATILVSRLGDTGLATAYYYSNNMGVTWNTMAQGSTSVSQYSLRAIFTGNPATPVIGMSANVNSVVTLIYYTSLGATPVQVGSLTTSAAAAQLAYGNAKIVKGFAFFCSVSTGTTSVNPAAATSSWFACAVSADMTVPANWKQTGTCAGAQMVDLVFFNNTWLAVGYGGIYYAPNPGTVNAPQPPTAAWGTAVNTGANPVWSIATNGTIAVAVGEDPVNANIGAIWTSTDGVHWNKVNRFLTTSASVSNGCCFTNVIWDGSQFIATGGQNGNVIVVSPDGIAWTAVYYPDYTETAGTATASPLGVFSGTINPATGVYVPYNATASFVQAVGFVSGPVVGGVTRTVNPVHVTGTAAVTTQVPAATVPISTLSHYYELIATATATVNAFTWQWALDGVIQGTLNALPSSGAFSPVGDTTGTNHLIINLPRQGNFTVIDDIYVTDFAADPAGNTGQMGVVNIVPKIANADVQTQFTQNGTAPTHAAQVAGALSNSEGTVSTFTVGAKDLYNTQNNIPANYRVQAVQVEAFFSKFGTIGANASVGIVSSGSEVDSTAVSALTTNPVFANFIQSLDPKTGQQWTIAGINAAQLAATKVT